MLELNQGTQLADRYTLVRRLGGDGLTQIWLARDRLTKASVALKIGSGDPEGVASLRAEWKASIRLMHAHIVRAFEFHNDSEAVFFSQQFIDGPDLSALTGLPIEDILAPVGLLVEALAYLHSKGQVHRDLKASNVLLDGNGAPYLSDFGASTMVGESGSGGSLIAQSPQSLDGQPASAADDMFALGGLVFELISGRPPWLSVDIADEIKHQTAAPILASDGSTVPDFIVVLVEELLAKEPTQRPTAKEVLTRLTAAKFLPGTASIRNRVRREVHEEVIESVDAIRRAPAIDRAFIKPVHENVSGISQKVVGVTLGALLAILVVVIFVLPNSVSEQLETVDDSQQVAGDSANSEPSDSDENSRTDVYIDSEALKQMQDTANMPTRSLKDDDDITFSENLADYSGLDEMERERFNAEVTLGELLSALEVLESRGVERWAAREHREAKDMYAEADRAYLKKDFTYAEKLYLDALTLLEPLYARIEPIFQRAYADGIAAFEEGDRLKAIQSYELAVVITPTHAGALAGYQRAKNLEAVLRLVDQGIEYEEDLELDAAQSSFERAVALDNLWQPAHDGIVRVRRTRLEMEFDTRMTEGFDAISSGDYLGARAAFRVAERLIPESKEPADGFLQVDQGLRLQEIMTLEREAYVLESDEHWDAVVKTYEEILKVDSTLSFAMEGLIRGRGMAALHARLDGLIADPDRLSVPSVMQKATMLIVDITTRPSAGERLKLQRDELSRLLKRAATTLRVPLLSDNVTNVSIYKIGRLGNFMRKEIDLRPGTYVAVGSRSGFRDVRLEFRVAPEIEMEPLVIQCEEQI